MSTKNIPVVDIFAGPGGLAEGFAKAGYDIIISAEMDKIACETLRLRKFYHQFMPQNIPDEFYQFLHGKISQLELTQRFQGEWKRACSSVVNVELGTPCGNAIFQSLMDEKLKNSNEFILVGGPPCQAYSLAGRSRMLGVGNRTYYEDDMTEDALRMSIAKQFYKDKRHTLYLEYLRILCRYQPSIFVMENVKGLGSAKAAASAAPGSVFSNISTGLKDPYAATGELTRSGQLPRGYKLYSLADYENGLFSTIQAEKPSDFVVRSEYHGVPQTRHRIIIIGVREDLAIKPARIPISKNLNTVRDAIGSLPKLRSGLSKEEDTHENWKNAIVEQVQTSLLNQTVYDDALLETINALQKSNILLSRGQKFVKSRKREDRTPKCDLLDFVEDPKLNGIIQHETRSHIRADLLRYFLVSFLGAKFGKSPKLQDWQGDLTYLKPKHRNIDANGAKLSTHSHADRFKVQVWDKPASTIVSHISKDGHYFIHPDPTQARSLTVREAARLQTFPDNYFFCGTRTQQYHQVGNAVPPFLAFQIAQVVRQCS